MNIQKKIETALSPDQVRNIYKKMNGGKDVKIVMLHDVNESMSADTIMGADNCIIVFIDVMSEFNGHYVSIFRRDNDYYFMDSYGNTPKKLLDIINNLGHVHDSTLMFHILFENARECYYSNVEYQKKDGNVADCGRYAILNLTFFNQIDGYNFAMQRRYFKNYMAANNISDYDVAVTMLTS